MLKFEKEELLSSSISKYNKITKYISLIRLIIAIILIALLIALMSLNSPLLYGLLSIIVFLFLIFFILFTNKYYEKLESLNNLKRVYKNHYRRRNKELEAFYDEGNEFKNNNDYKLSDLDIFGSKSLFAYLNCCKTKLGREKLNIQLTNPIKKPKEFSECIAKLGENEQSLNIEAGLMSFNNIKGINHDEINSVTRLKISFDYKKIIPLFIYILMIIYIPLMLIINLPFTVLFLFIILNLFSSKICLNNEVYKIDSFKYYNYLDAYYKISNVIINTDIDDKYFNMQKDIIKNNLSNLKNIKSIYLSLSSRKNIIFNILLNALFIYDFWLIFIYNKKTKNIDSLNNIFDAISEIELMLSFANIAIDNEYYCIASSADLISTSQMYHPLIKNCIPNDITISGGIILTGSNMSGKTTFMRTLGINQILFNAGSIICAKEYNSYYMNVLTSLRANDMLSEGISTFYAEILRMKNINNYIKSERNLILIDEIFKGTNANERIKASFEVILKFNKYNQLFIISTHDFELCDALNISNYHFDEKYIDDSITFDYKIKNGKCESKNALYLLRMTNIIED